MEINLGFILIRVRRIFRRRGADTGGVRGMYPVGARHICAADMSFESFRDRVAALVHAALKANQPDHCQIANQRQRAQLQRSN